MIYVLFKRLLPHLIHIITTICIFHCVDTCLRLKCALPTSTFLLYESYMRLFLYLSSFYKVSKNQSAMLVILVNFSVGIIVFINLSCIHVPCCDTVTTSGIVYRINAFTICISIGLDEMS